MKTLPIGEELHGEVKNVSDQLGMTMNEYVALVLKHQNKAFSDALISKRLSVGRNADKVAQLEKTVENQKANINTLLKRIESLKKK